MIRSIMKSSSPLMMKKRPKTECEICGEKDSNILHRHHIVERSELHTDNDDMNLVIACPSCHSKIHDGSIEIIGVFPGTRPPTGRILVYKVDGVCNIPGMEDEKPYYVPKPQSMPLFLPEEDNNDN